MNRLYKIPWSRPIPLGEYALSPVQYDCILFQLESASGTGVKWDYVDRLGRGDAQKFPFRYRCLSCYMASGSGDSFSTQCEQRHLFRDGPTEAQKDQMSEHARQHSIMWAWAKGLK